MKRKVGKIKNSLFYCVYKKCKKKRKIEKNEKIENNEKIKKKWTNEKNGKFEEIV